MVKDLGPIEATLQRPSEVKNMVYRGLDQDGNAGVVFERMAQVLLRCTGTAQQSCLALGQNFRTNHPKNEKMNIRTVGLLGWSFGAQPGAPWTHSHINVAEGPGDVRRGSMAQGDEQRQKEHRTSGIYGVASQVVNMGRST